VNFVEKERFFFAIDCVGFTKTKDSLKNGGGHCMPYKPEMN
jgi:hypothetical protein